MKHTKNNKGKVTTQQYSHLMGDPMDPANHPATNVPAATQAYNGAVLNNPTSVPNIPGSMPFDDSVG